MEAVRSTWLTEAKRTESFEALFRKKTGAKYARAFCNGTMALFAALKVAGIGKGDEVILPDLTFIASSNAVVLSGARPVLADVDQTSFTLSPDGIRQKITRRTRAIMPVHLYGQAADMDAIMEIAGAHRLVVIEDAAQGVGVKFNGRHVGTFGDFGCFSFYGNKTITTGEGGMVITQSSTLDARIYALKNHGRGRRGTFIHDEIGYNFSFNEMAAAVGITQLKKLNLIIKKKAALRREYMKQLSDLSEIEFTRADERCAPVHWFINILVEDPESLQAYLGRKGIGTRRFFYPLHQQPCYRLKGRFPCSEYAYAHGLSLPSSARLEPESVHRICSEIHHYYRHHPARRNRPRRC